MRIDSTDELETNLIGVTVVVLAVNFMGAVFVGDTENFLSFGAGIALVNAALALFIGLRAYSTKLSKEAAAIEAQNNLGTSEEEDALTKEQKKAQLQRQP